MKIHVKIRGRKGAGKCACHLYQLQIEGDRAFLVWDSVILGGEELVTRMELNPQLIHKDPTREIYYYRGILELPQPENN